MQKGDGFNLMIAKLLSLSLPPLGKVTCTFSQENDEIKYSKLITFEVTGNNKRISLLF